MPISQESRLEVLLAHLLKWRFQPARRSSSWRGTIKEQKRKTARLLRQNPGLKPLIAEILADAYYSSLVVAERDTGIDEDAFPEACQWDFDQIRDNCGQTRIKNKSMINFGEVNQRGGLEWLV